MLHVEARHESNAHHWHHAPWRGEDHTARDAGLYMITGHFRHWQASSVSPASSACGFTAPPPTTASSSAVTLCSTGYGTDGRLCPRDTSNGPCPSGCAASSGSGATPTAAPRTTPIAPPPVQPPLPAC